MSASGKPYKTWDYLTFKIEILFKYILKTCFPYNNFHIISHCITTQTRCVTHSHSLWTVCIIHLVKLTYFLEKGNELSITVLSFIWISIERLSFTFKTCLKWKCKSNKLHRIILKIYLLATRIKITSVWSLYRL